MLNVSRACNVLMSGVGRLPELNHCSLHVQRAVRMLVARVDFSWLRLLESGSGGASMHPAAWQRALVRTSPGLR